MPHWEYESLKHILNFYKVSPTFRIPFNKPQSTLLFDHRNKLQDLLIRLGKLTNIVSSNINSFEDSSEIKENNSPKFVVGMLTLFSDFLHHSPFIIFFSANNARSGV